MANHENVGTIPALVSNRVILVRINRLFRPGMNPDELYETTRGVWRSSIERARNAELIFAVADQVVREVYRPRQFFRAGSTPYKYRAQAAMRRPNRWEFVGEVAEPAVRGCYRGMSVAHLDRGAQNPVTYLNM